MCVRVIDVFNLQACVSYMHNACELAGKLLQHSKLFPIELVTLRLSLSVLLFVTVVTVSGASLTTASISKIGTCICHISEYCFLRVLIG